MSEEEFGILAGYCEIKQFAKGEVLNRPGEVCDWLSLINEGILRYYHAVNGKEHIGEIFFKGQMVTDYCSYTLQTGSMIYIDVVKDCELVIIKKSDMEHLKQTMPGILKFIAAYLAMNYISNFQRNTSLLMDSAETRYLNLLRDRPEVVRQVPLYMVASYLGITPEALSRTRHKIAHTGG